MKSPGRFFTRGLLESRWSRVMPDGTRRPYEFAFTKDYLNRVDRRDGMIRSRGRR